MSSIEIVGKPDFPAREIKRLAATICKQEDPLHDYQISLKIVGSEEMRHYNRIYRGKDESTDVLSFVNSDIQIPPASQAGLSRPDTGCESHAKQESPALVMRLCDIIIDTNQLAKQMANRTFEEEFRTVLIHGLLHLVGYDHIRQQDIRIMKTKEEYYLKQQQGEEISGRR